MKKNPDFSNKLIMWYLLNKRDLPWRNTKDPYFIWLSEIILQQTRVSQGQKYYEKFVSEFPDITALSMADEKRILKLWQGLGYYSRARNMHHTAKFIAEHYQGKFPTQFTDIIALKGVGDYTASAISSIAFDRPEAVVDGNVYRVLSRYFGIRDPIDSTIGKKKFKILAQELIDPERPGDHNQALMEFGAMVCKPKKALCDTCPLNESCFALQTKSIDELPVKTQKIQTKEKHLHFFVLNQKNEKTLLRRRTQPGIWHHLFEFPSLESKPPHEDIIEGSQFIKKMFGLEEGYKLKKYNADPVIHNLTHRKIYATFWLIESTEPVKGSVPWEEIEHYALPVLLQNFVDKYRGLS